MPHGQIGVRDMSRRTHEAREESSVTARLAGIQIAAELVHERASMKARWEDHAAEAVRRLCDAA